MKRLYNLILACLFIVSLSACGKQAVSETEQTEAQTEDILTDREEQKIEGGDNTVTGDISFNFETKTVLLNSGYEMPIYGLGTYSLTGDTCVESVTAALNSGVRLIDTAYMYHNEESVGEAVRNSGIPREEIFVITKLYPNQFSDAEAAIEEALARLDIEYIDMMLLHHPGAGDVEAYLAMEKAVADGKIRSLGLSNWYVEELEEFLPQINITPALVQNEIHPYYQENDVIPYIHRLVQHCANNSEYSTCYLHQYCVVVSQQCHRIASFLRLVLSQISGTVFHCYLGNAVLEGRRSRQLSPEKTSREVVSPVF